MIKIFPDKADGKIIEMEDFKFLDLLPEYFFQCQRKVIDTSKLVNASYIYASVFRTSDEGTLAVRLEHKTTKFSPDMRRDFTVSGYYNAYVYMSYHAFGRSNSLPVMIHELLGEGDVTHLRDDILTIRAMVNI